MSNPMSLEEQGILLKNVTAALAAHPLTRRRWDRVRVLHGGNLTAGQRPECLGRDMLRVEVGLAELVNYERDGDRHQRFDIEYLSLDFPDAEIPQRDIPERVVERVVERVRAHLEEK